MNESVNRPEQLLIAETQLLLAEERTYYSLFRTGIAVASLPASLLVFLLATSQFHKLFNSPGFTVVTITVLGIMSLLGVGLIRRSQRKISHIHRYIRRIKSENKRLAEIIV